jgi:predicted nucleic acid-binding protein
MEIVADASVFLAVLPDEVNRNRAIENTSGLVLISPEVLPCEIANALSSVTRKGRLADRESLKAFKVSQNIQIRLQPIRIHGALVI